MTDVSNTIIEIEDFLPADHADYIEDALLKSRLYPWYFNPNTVSNDHQTHEKNIPGFFHMIYDKQKPKKDEFFDLINPIALQLSAKTDIAFTEVLRVQTNLIFPVPIEGPHLPHIDNFEHHYVAIYYVNDSDGPTYLYEQTNETYDLQFDLDITNDPNRHWPIAKKIEPKKGKLVLFNGHRYHSSSSPSENVRSIVNINIR